MKIKIGDKVVVRTMTYFGREGTVIDIRKYHNLTILTLRCEELICFDGILKVWSSDVRRLRKERNGDR